MGDAEAEEEGEIRAFDEEGVGVGLSFAIGTAEVTERTAARPMNKGLRCMVALFGDLWQMNCG